MIDGTTFTALRSVSTCNVCDAIELLGFAPGTGVVRGLSRINNAARQVMVGLACTATFRSAAARPPAVVNQALGVQLERLRELPGPGVVVFQDLDVPWFGATGGEIRCRFYERGGADGVMTSGAVRDLDGISDLEMPVYASAITCTHGHHYVPQLDVPVMVGGVTIMTGDLIHGDRNGIVVVPHRVIEVVADVAYQIATLEMELLSVIRGRDASLSDALDAREAFQAGVAALRRKVQAAR